MRYKKEQDKPFYAILDAFKTVKPAEKDQAKVPSSAMGHQSNHGKESAKTAADFAEEKKQRQLLAKQLRQQKDAKARQVQEQYLLSIIDRMSREQNIDFILPKERSNGDALKLIMEIAVVLNWKQPSDDAIVQFLKQYPTL